MRKLLTACLIAVLVMSVFNIGVTAAPKPIKKEAVELKIDTIFVKEVGTAGNSDKKKTVKSYKIEYVNPDAGDSSGCTKIYPPGHYWKLGGYMILKADISSVKNASEFNLKFSFDTGSNIENSVFVYWAYYSDGQALVDGLTPGSSKNVTVKPDICTALGDNTVYQFDKTVASVESVDAEISTADSAVLKKHMDDAISKGEDSVYFLVRGVIGSAGSKSEDSYFKYYNSASADKAPTLSVTVSAVSSAVTETETGYTVSVSGLQNYSEKVLLAVTAFDSGDSLVQTSVSGYTSVTDIPIDIDVPCKNAAKLKLYIWHAGTLEPVTYPETIILD